MRTVESSAPFTDDEYRRRLRRIQEELGRRQLDAVGITSPENIYYVCGFTGLGYFSFQMLVITADGSIFFVVRGGEKEAILRDTQVERVYEYGDGHDPVAATREALVDYGLADARIGIELDSWFLTVPVYLTLNEAFSFTDASQLVNKVRLVKSDEEIAYIRKAVDIMELGAQAAIDVVRPGVTENEIAAKLMEATIAAGSDYLGHAPIVASGPRSHESFDTWSGRTISADELIAFEPGAAVHRYHAMVIRPISVGPLDSYVDRLSKVSVAGLEVGFDFIKPGVTGDEVNARVKEHARSEGLGDLARSRCGYSVGIGYPPDWGEGRTASLGPGDTTVLEENMVFHFMNPLLDVGVGKVNISDMIRVTKDGCEVLSTRLHRGVIAV